MTRGTFMDERKNRQLLEDHIKVITAVCKKLNADIEVKYYFLIQQQTFIYINLLQGFGKPFKRKHLQI